MLTPRLQVTDHGTRFHVGTGAKADYLSVEKGAVDIKYGDWQHTYLAGQALITTGAGDPTVLTLSPQPPETVVTQPLRVVAASFSAGNISTIQWEKDVKRLAARFPKVRCVVSPGASANYGTPLGGTGPVWTGMLDVGDQHNALQAHLSQIARVLAGDPDDGQPWDIPAGVMEVGDLQKQFDLPEDIYYVTLAPKAGSFTWRFHGAGGEQVDIPVKFEVPQGRGSLTASIGALTVEVPDFNEFGAVPQYEKLWVLNWPGDKKPSLTLPINDQQWRDAGRQRVAELQRQCRTIPEINLFAAYYDDTFYFDLPCKYHLRIVDNKNSAQQIYRALEQGKQGQSVSVVLGVLDTTLPLADPPADAGAYLVRYVQPASSQAPLLEIATLDNHPVAAWHGPTRALKSSGRLEQNVDMNYPITGDAFVTPTHDRLEWSGTIFRFSSETSSVELAVHQQPDDPANPGRSQFKTLASGSIQLKLSR